METVIQRTTRKDQEIATKSISALNSTAAAFLKKKPNVVKIKIQENDEFVTVPGKALELLFDILSNMAEGKSITLIPSEAEVSTQQAADLLNVSRPHVVKLLEQGLIPYKKVGSHRRVLLEDLVAYEAKQKDQRTASLKHLAQQAQDLSLGYE